MNGKFVKMLWSNVILTVLAGRYTLLEQEALDPFRPLCAPRNASVVVGGGFNSGILATGAKDGAKYNYSPAPETIKRRVQAIESVCKEFQVPLPAAALQFVVAHPAVPTFMAGTRTVKQLKQNILGSLILSRASFGQP